MTILNREREEYETQKYVYYARKRKKTEDEGGERNRRIVVKGDEGGEKPRKRVKGRYDSSAID